DVATGIAVRRFEGHEGAVAAVVVTPDGRTVITASNSGDGALRAWSADRGRPAWAAGGNGPASRITALALSPDGRTVVAADMGGFGFWDPTTGGLQQRIDIERRGINPHVGALACTHDGRQLVSVTYDGLAHVTDLATKQTRSFRIHRDLPWTVAV